MAACCYVVELSKAKTPLIFMLLCSVFFVLTTSRSLLVQNHLLLLRVLRHFLYSELLFQLSNPSSLPNYETISIKRALKTTM